MRQLIGILCLFSASAFAQTAQTAGHDFSALQFLAGAWEADSKPGEGSGSCDFMPDLHAKVVVRHNHAEYPPSDGRPAVVHDDLMIIYREGTPSAIRAIYFDNEGHVIRYSADTSTTGKAVFTSEVVANQPRYRLSYAALSDGRISGRFEIAPPGKPDAFNKYLEWSLRRKANP